MLYRYAIRDKRTHEEIDEALFIDLAVKSVLYHEEEALRYQTHKHYEIYDRKTDSVLE